MDDLRISVDFPRRFVGDGWNAGRPQGGTVPISNQKDAEALALEGHYPELLDRGKNDCGFGVFARTDIHRGGCHIFAGYLRNSARSRR